MTARHFHFLRSVFACEGNHQTRFVLDWLKRQNEAVDARIAQIPLGDLSCWRFHHGSIQHDSGKFFSIDGIRVRTNWGKIHEWDQPIINQPEIGYLGFITREFDGVLHFLMQAKIEPGNINAVQLSPTLQATRSNYTRAHQGQKPPYLEYFLNATSGEILLDQLQSEQGARFLKKRNRNIIIKVDDDIPVFENFIWLTLGQIKKLMRFDNFVNMDSRTVIAGIPFGNFDPEVIDFFNFLSQAQQAGQKPNIFLKSALSDEGRLHSIEAIITFLTQLKSAYDLDVQKKPLDRLEHWLCDTMEIRHRDNRFFQVIGLDIQIGNREVNHWNQPMVQPAQEGLCAFVCKEINGILHFAVQAKLECGNHDIIEFAPTVQCLTGNYRQTREGSLPFLDYVLSARPEQIVFDTLQSEEGGRFYREQNRNMIVLAGDEIPVELPDHFIWMTLSQLYTFLRFNNYLNIQARSLIAAISFTE